MTHPDFDTRSARRHRFAPALLLLALTVLAFAAGTLAPYRLDTDTAFQLESVRQWLHGAVPMPGTLRLPDPRDLSRDTLLWSNWFPPAFPFLYAPLAAAGLPFAASLRLTSFLLFVLGSLGWLRLAGRLDLPRAVRLLFALSLAGYALTIGGAASLRTADLLSYAAAPWLAALALAGGRESRAPALLLTGLALGATYWLRYSLFLTALPLLAWVAFRCCFSPLYRRGLVRLAALGLGFALPVAALFLLNLSRSANLAESATGTRTAWVIGDKTPVRPLRLAAGLAGAPGLGLFQNDLWLHHLVSFSDARLLFLRGKSAADRIFLKSLLGIPATAALAWGLFRSRRRLSGPLPDLSAAVPAGFYLALAAVSLLVGYNYLINEVRFAAGVLPLAQPLVLAGWLDRDGRRAGGRAFGVLCLAALFLPPLAFAAANFAKNDLLDRARPPYTATAAGLFTPELSRRDAAGVQAAVAGAVRGPRDVVVLAGPRGWGSSFVIWPEIEQRAFPVSTYVAPLGARFAAADLDSRAPLTTSRPLRIVLVADRSLAADGSLAALQARFPQAGPWTAVPAPPDAAVVLLRSDLLGRAP